MVFYILLGILYGDMWRIAADLINIKPIMVEAKHFTHILVACSRLGRISIGAYGLWGLVQ